MRTLSCQRCGHPVMWDGASEIVRCDVCGTRYRMHPRGTSQRGGRTGAGEVAPIPTTQGRYAGAPLVRSYVPKGWTVATNAPEAESNLMSPLIPQVEYSAPGGQACITYTGARGFNHLEPTPQNAPMQGRMAMPERMVGLAYRDASAVCEGFVRDNPNLADARLLSEFDRPDACVEKLLSATMAEYTQAGTLNPGGSWSKKYFEVKDRQGRTWHKLIEALVTHAWLPVPAHEQQLYQMLLQTQARVSMFGMANQVKPPQPKLRWVVNYVIETSAAAPVFPEAMKAHDQIRNSFETLPLFKQEGDRIREALTLQYMQDTNTINNALGQMNRDRMASWDRRQNIIRETSDYTTRVMRDMRQSTADTHQRVANLRSEAIRGVNTYYTNAGDPRVVEASTQWDHVYQNRQHPDIYAASTGEPPLEFGVDFEELRRTDGNY